jgi:hypothetical protein
MAPLNFANVPFSGEKNERAAEGLMRLERAAPGTLGAGMQGEAGARAMVETTIAAALGGEALERTSSVDPALSANSTRARGLAAATAGGMLTQRWQAHHLVPFDSIASLPPALQTKMAAAGWKMDSAENLIALPADPATFQGPPNNGALPMHNGSHPRYSSFVNGQLGYLRAHHQSMNPAQIRAELDRIETHMQTELLNKVYHSRVH